MHGIQNSCVEVNGAVGSGAVRLAHAVTDGFRLAGKRWSLLKALVMSLWTLIS